MGFGQFGKKLSHVAHSIGKKSVSVVNTIGKKSGHIVDIARQGEHVLHTGLHIANKVTNALSKANIPIFDPLVDLANSGIGLAKGAEDQLHRAIKQGDHVTRDIKGLSQNMRDRDIKEIGNKINKVRNIAKNNNLRLL